MFSAKIIIKKKEKQEESYRNKKEEKGKGNRYRSWINIRKYYMDMEWIYVCI